MGLSALVEACDRNHVSQVEKLIKARANVNHQNATGHSLLHTAAQSTRFEILQLLLGGGVYVNTRDGADHTPLHRACMPFLGRKRDAPDDTLLDGSPGCVKLLIDRGARIEVHHWAGWTPLMEACSRGHIGVIRLLLQAGADPNRQNPVKLHWKGWTRLMYAATAARNRKEACKVLGTQISELEMRRGKKQCRRLGERKYVSV